MSCIYHVVCFLTNFALIFKLKLNILKYDF
jgi:hypothetical protein